MSKKARKCDPSLRKDTEPDPDVRVIRQKL